MKIYLETLINAAPEICFNLARSIDLHQRTMQHTGERAVAGITAGLIGLNETVTWEARHFGVKMQLCSRITSFKYGLTFTDEQVKGPFKRLHHVHTFIAQAGGTLMTDEFRCDLPFGILGWLADKLVMKRYLGKLLTYRNHIIKEAAEQSVA